MKYLTWFMRLVFGSWMLANGLMHFLHLWPQPMGDTPLSRELTAGLIDSHLFILVKAVEVIAGISMLTGLYVPLWAIVALPVSFVVCYYGEVLERSNTHHGALFVLGPNLVICLSYWKSYRPMFALRAHPRDFAPTMAPAPAE